MQTLSKALVATLLTLATGCQSTTLYAKGRATLEAAETNIEQGQYADVQAPLERLVAETAKADGNYALQQFFASILLVRANLAASLNEPFLREPISSRGSNSKPSWIAQTVASSYEVAFAEQRAGAAEASPGSIDGEALLPESLASYGVPTARQFLAIVRLVTAARLGFQQDVSALLQAHPELENLDTCEQEMQTTGIDDATKPWVLFGIFEYLKARDEPLAYRFGIRARELSGQSKSAQDARLGDRIVRWILDESSYAFESNRGVPFDPGLAGDSDAGQGNIDYLYRKKDSK